MNMVTDDRNIHVDHRSRMRNKLERHGGEIFDTYELLEMLLYYVIPYKDTNPISKRLLMRFGTLDAVLSAPVCELVEVSGVGECAAEHLRCVGRLSSVIGSEPDSDSSRLIDGYTRAGQYLIDYFRDDSEPSVVMMLLDNSKNLITTERLYEGRDYDSAAVRPEVFVKAAVRHNASMVITAHNHPHGIFYPSAGDIATDALVSRALSATGVHYIDHIVVSGERFVGVSRMRGMGFVRSDATDFFSSDGARAEDLDAFSRVRHDNLTVLLDSLARIAANESERDRITEALDKYRSVENLLAADIRVLTDDVGKKAALALKLYAYVLSRRVTDKFRFGIHHSSDEIINYFKALYIGVPDETVYMMGFDSGDCPTCCELISEGIVNESEILPKKLIHTALSTSSRSVVIAHNHPFGTAEPSDDDVSFTSSVAASLELSKIELKYHVVIAGQTASVLGKE